MDDLETRLKRYRPAGPPHELRARVISAARGRRRVKDWLPPLAAAAAVALFYSLAANERARTGEPAARDAEVRQVMLNEISAALGDDDLARAEALRLIEQNEQAARREAERPFSSDQVFAYD